MKYLLFLFIACFAACKVQPRHEDLIDHWISSNNALVKMDSASLVFYVLNCKYTIDSVRHCDTLPCFDSCFAFSYFDNMYEYDGGKVSGRFSNDFSTESFRLDVGSVVNRKKQGIWETLAEARDTIYYRECLGDFETSSKYLLLFSTVYEDGLRDGPFVAYNIYTSKVLYKTMFVNGTGYEKTYYQCKGTPIRSEGQFTHDKKTGKWVYYTVKGKKTVVYY